MSKPQLNTEQTILAAAEEVFLSKGYAAAKTTEIAKLAGVNHAMLHYYFRTKESLFNKVFEEKVNMLSHSFLMVFEMNLPFKEKIIMAVGKHYDFLVENPRLPLFVLTEMLTNEERKNQVKKILKPRLKMLQHDLQQNIDEEVKKGNIKPTLGVDTILNTVSLNIFSVVFTQMIADGNNYLDNMTTDDILKHRRENNIQLILKGLGI